MFKIDKVLSPKNQLSQTNSPSTVGCSLEYPIAKFTIKLEAQLLSSQNYALYHGWDAQFICDLLSENGRHIPQIPSYCFSINKVKKEYTTEV